jgi:hypothetical protein
MPGVCAVVEWFKLTLPQAKEIRRRARDLGIHRLIVVRHHEQPVDERGQIESRWLSATMKNCAGPTW